MRVFFSHANEDKPVVEQVFLRVRARFPDIQGWLDKYEIVGGDDLIDKIHAGIEQANKFLIFLSASSIDKPWVRAELRKALMAEVKGIKPEFIVPIKLGKISQFPPFLESRFYIDLETKQEAEWLEDIHRAITQQRRPLETPTENLAVNVQIAADNKSAALILFEARFWAEPIAFKVNAGEKILSRMWSIPKLKGMQQVSISELKTDGTYGVRIYDRVISPGNPFYMGIEFEGGGDPRGKIRKVDRWDGVGGEQSMRFIQFA